MVAVATSTHNVSQCPVKADFGSTSDTIPATAVFTATRRNRFRFLAGSKLSRLSSLQHKNRQTLLTLPLRERPNLVLHWMQDKCLDAPPGLTPIPIDTGQAQSQTTTILEELLRTAEQQINKVGRPQPSDETNGRLCPSCPRGRRRYPKKKASSPFSVLIATRQPDSQIAVFHEQLRSQEHTHCPRLRVN